MKSILLLIACTLLSSCSLLTRKGDWGKDAFWPLKGSRIKDAFIKNITSPHVWIPASGAAITYFGNYDKKITRWAHDENLFFDNHEDASDWSDNLLTILENEMYLSMFLTASSSEDPTIKEYVVNKGKGYLVIRIATRSTDIVRDKAANFFKREKPNHVNKRSFPSGHSSKAASRSMITNRNLDSIPMNEYLRTGIRSVNTSAAGLMLIARVEGNAHYPSDALMGYALGSFFSGFLYDALMNMDPNEFVSIVPNNGGIQWQYTLNF